jgi:hypothetical protein
VAVLSLTDTVTQAPMDVDAYTAALKQQYAQVAHIASVLGIARK